MPRTAADPARERLSAEVATVLDVAQPSADPTPENTPGPHPSGPRGNLALYRRYRSSTFAEVIGQEHVTEPLSVALEAHRINHAYLFSGPRGCGKTSSARILARSLNCRQGPTATPCGVCDSCAELAPNGPGSIDVIEIDAASHNGVDDARDLRERAYYSPARDRFKVYIIDEAHMVTSHAFNALLKVVEEPPEHIVFIFATTEPDKVLQTIRSRTHHYPFRLVAPSVLRAHLENIAGQESVTVEPAVYPLVVRAGAGSVRDALSLLDQLFAGADAQGVTYQRAVALLGVTDAALIDDMIDALAVSDGASVYGTVDRVIEAGHEPRRFATDLLDRLRDLLIIEAVPDAAEKGLLDAPVDALERMRDQAARIGVTAAARYAETVHAALTEMRGTTAPRLLLELVCARMLLPDASADSSALLQRLERVERLQRMQVTGSTDAAPTRVDAAASVDDRTHAPGAPTTSGAPTSSGRSAASPEPPTVLTRPAPSAVESTPTAPEAAPSATAAPAPDAGAAGTVPAGGLDVTAVRALWPEVLDAVKSSSRRTRALLDSAQVAGIDGYNLRLVMATAPLVKMLGEPSNADVVTAALAGLLPGSWTIQVEVGADLNAAAPLPTQRPEPSVQRFEPTASQPPPDQESPAPAPADRRSPEPAAADPDDRGPVDPPPARGPRASGASTGPTTAPPTIARAASTEAATEPAPAAADDGWPTVAAIPTAAAPAPKLVPVTPTGRGSRRRSAPPRDEAPPEQPDDDPDDEHLGEADDEHRGEADDEHLGEADDAGSPSARHDPETQALDLLKNGLGARPIDG